MDIFQHIIDSLGAVAADEKIGIGTCLFNLLVSLLLGSVIGFERQMRRRDAGLRTFTLICVGSTMAMLVSIWIPQNYPDFLNGDPGRIAAQVLTGIGFLGAGAIIQSKGGISGLTTAACIWLVSAVGLGVGAGLYLASAVTTALTLFVLCSLERFEKRFYLNGVNKVLSVRCSAAQPDTEHIARVVQQDGKLTIMSTSFEHNFDTGTCTVTYHVNVKPTFSQTTLCRQLSELDYVTGVKMVS